MIPYLVNDLSPQDDLKAGNENEHENERQNENGNADGVPYWSTEEPANTDMWKNIYAHIPQNGIYAITRAHKQS
jgi:hypothetical protein